MLSESLDQEESVSELEPLKQRVAELEAQLASETERANANANDAQRAKHTLERYRASMEHQAIWTSENQQELEQLRTALAERAKEQPGG